MSIKIALRHIYKIFGDAPLSVLPLVQDKEIDKQTLLEEYGHMLGLQDINLDIRSNQITVIMGLSGSGKSTLIRHFNRLIEPTSGNITLDGEDILAMNDADIRHMRRARMSMVFQKFALFPHYTVMKNVGLAHKIDGMNDKEIAEETREWLERVELTGYEDHYPHQLSGGMQQRVGIARALASDAEIMLMDEAFSALDPLIRNSMQDLLLTLQAELKKTIIFITHDLDEALKLADHLVILKDGLIVQQGEPQHILLHPNDPYIEDFVGAINRARVLRARSIMNPIEPSFNITEYTGKIDYDDTLEDVIACAEGDTYKRFAVYKDAQPVGTLDMKQLVKALVPRVETQ